MQGILDDADLVEVLALSYIQKFTDTTILGGVTVLLRTSHTCRRSLFVRRVLEIVTKRFHRTNDPHNLARIASMYLNLTVASAPYRIDYVDAANAFFGMFPPRVPKLLACTHETQYWAVNQRHVKSVMVESGIMHVLALHFRRRKCEGIWSPEHTRASLQQDHDTFSCGVFGLLGCISVIDTSCVLPCAMNPDFKLHVTQGILENASLFPMQPRLYIASIQLLRLMCPVSCVESALDYLLQQFSAVVLRVDSSDAQQCDTGMEVEWTSPASSPTTSQASDWQERQHMENTLTQCIEHIVTRQDLVKSTENYVALKSCLGDIASAGIAIVLEGQLCSADIHQGMNDDRIVDTRAQTHMNTCCLLNHILPRCSGVTEKELLAILDYVQHLANASLLSILSFSIVTLLSRLVSVYRVARQAFNPPALQNLLELLHTTMHTTGHNFCNKESVLVLAECVMCILVEQRPQLSCGAWDVMSEICSGQLRHKQDNNLPCPDGLVEALIISAQHTSDVTFGTTLSSMKSIYERFGSVVGMNSRKRRQFIDLLNIPLCRGLIFPKAQMKQIFSDLGVIKHAEEFAHLFSRLENSKGRHTCGMLSVVHTLFLLVLFQESEYSTKDTTLRLCAKIMSAPNVREPHRIRTYSMMVELLGRYHRCSMDGIFPGTACAMCPALILHLVRAIIPLPNRIVYSEVPLILCIISALLTHGRFMCLCEKNTSSGGPGSVACREIYTFCGGVLADFKIMAATAVHRHGVLLVQRIIRRLLTSPVHRHDIATPFISKQFLLERLDDVRRLIMEHPDTFPTCAHVNGLADNDAIRDLLRVRV